MDRERRDFLQDSTRLTGFALANAVLWRIEPVLAQNGRGHELGTMTMVQLSQLLASGKITSRQLVEQALAAIKDPQGEGSRTFLSVHESETLAAADQVDAQRRAGAKLPALAGIPISIKDLRGRLRGRNGLGKSERSSTTGRASIASRGAASSIDCHMA